MIIKKLRVAAIAAGAAAMIAVPAAAGATDATFSLTGGGLSMSVPNTTPETRVNLGSASVGALTLQGQLGDVRVTDNRGSLVAAWTARVTATDFVHRDAGNEPSAQEVVSRANIAYSSGAATGSGTGTFAPGVVASMDLADQLRIAGTWAGVGVNERTWNPTLTFILSADQVAGSYDGTITHSVN